MHRGVQSLTSWLDKNRSAPGVELQPPATALELAAVEDRILSPLPADLRVVLSRCNGAKLPSGVLLAAKQGGEAGTIQDVLRTVSQELGRPEQDPEMLLPFFQKDDGGVLAFDRSAGPVSDTWPIVDFYPDSGEVRLVHRTFDGFCRLCVAEWTADDFSAPFSLEKYLNAGQRHAQVEPDVCVAHVTVAHALRRAGKPDLALKQYLVAARCVPALPWADWEALKIAALLGDTRAAIEAAGRLCARAPQARWTQRETTPTQVADVLGHVIAKLPNREPVLRLFDQLADQASDAENRAHIVAIRKAAYEKADLPEPIPVRPCAVPAQDSMSDWMAGITAAYAAGQLRDEDLLLEPAYAPLRDKADLGSVLRTARSF